MTDTERLNALEMRVVHQDETIDDLNDTVTAQWKEIDRLTREVAALTERVATAELNSAHGEAGEEAPPPHY